mgnify:CR=1 FL=1
MNECGSILSNGTSIIIAKKTELKILYQSLPNEEKIVQLALGFSEIIALSSTGKVYSSDYKSESKFVEVEELKNIKWILFLNQLKFLVGKI